MKKIMALAVISFILSAAQYSGAADAGSWLKSATHRLGKVKKERPKRPSGLAGVKGDEKGSASAIYWKEDKVSGDEAALFEEAVMLAEDGDLPGAAERLREFVEKYPGSPLAGEAREGLKIIEGGGGG